MKQDKKKKKKKKKKKNNESDDWEGIIFQMQGRAWVGNT